MENFSALLSILTVLAFCICLFSAPVKLVLKILANALCGFLCLWLLNFTAGFTGLSFPINMITAATAGFLGLPGIALLAAVQILL